MGEEIQKIDTRLRIYILTYYKVIWEIDIDLEDHFCVIILERIYDICK